MAIKSSKILHDFYVSWNEWAVAMAADPRDYSKRGPYSPANGLCTSLNAYLLKASYADYHLSGQTATEMLYQFIRDNKDPTYPFGKSRYLQDVAFGSAHLSPERLAWVRDRIADGVDPCPEPIVQLKSSKALRWFYRDWMSWVKGMHSNVKYTGSDGLCYAAYKYREETGIDVRQEMSRQFKRAIELNLIPNGDRSYLYPFGYEEYKIRLEAGTQHEDPNRLKWVRRRLVDGIGEGE